MDPHIRYALLLSAELERRARQKLKAKTGKEPPVWETYDQIGRALKCPRS